MKILNQQIQAIHAKLPLEIKSDPEQKKDLIAQFTGDINKISTKNLTYEQANELIKSLGGKPVYNVRTTQGKGASFFHFNYQNKQHRTILSLAHQYGWEATKNGTHIVNMVKLAGWLMNKAPVNKPLGKQDAKELSKTITALENMVAQKYKQ